MTIPTCLVYSGVWVCLGQCALHDVRKYCTTKCVRGTAAGVSGLVVAGKRGRRRMGTSMRESVG